MRVPSSSARARAKADRSLFASAGLNEHAKLLTCLPERRLTSADSDLGSTGRAVQRLIPVSPAACAVLQPLAQNLKPRDLGSGYRHFLVVARVPAGHYRVWPGGLNGVRTVLLHDRDSDTGRAALPATAAAKASQVRRDGREITSLG